jgi:hypothetical protein
MEGKDLRVCCENCYFRRAELCALQLSEACPTYRPHEGGALSRQAPVRLAPRPLDEIVRAQVMSRAAAAA